MSKLSCVWVRITKGKVSENEKEMLGAHLCASVNPNRRGGRTRKMKVRLRLAVSEV